MKTSNKILLAVWTFLAVSILSLAIAARQNAVYYEKSHFENFAHIEGNGEFITEERSPGDYTGLHNMANIDIELVPGNGPILITSESNLINHIETRVVSGFLKITYSQGVELRTSSRIVAKVPADNLEILNLNGGGSVTGFSNFKKDRFAIEMNGGGYVDLSIEASTVEVDFQGGGQVKLSGSTQLLSVRSTGGGEFKGLELPSSMATVTTRGGGIIRLNVSESLAVDMSGGGTVEYLGRPEVTSDISGGGVVRALGLEEN